MSTTTIEWNPSVSELTFCKAYNMLLKSDEQQIGNDQVRAFGTQGVAPVVSLGKENYCYCYNC